jgi:uncharacterized membrane protein
MSLTINAVFETLKGYKLTLSGVFPLFNYLLLLPQANGPACVDSGCTHRIDGLCGSPPIYLLGFFSKYECWVIDLIMFLYHFILFLGCHLCFCTMRFHITLKCQNKIHMTNF